MRSKIRPVLMIPLRRCGSHALRLRLNLSPEFYAPYPLHIVDFIDLLPLYGDLNQPTRYFQLIVDLVGLQNASMVKWKNVVLDPVVLFERVQERAPNIHTVLWEMLHSAAEQRQAQVVMDKSLDSVFYAEELLRVHPDMLFLNIIRDPRAQISSMNKAIIYDFNTLLNTQRWVKAYRKAREIEQKYPERTLTLRFEDFVVHQEDTLRRICDFVGISFIPDMIKISQSQEATELSRLSTLWKNNGFDPIVSNINKFTEKLTRDDILLIETLTEELMDYYGYERMTTGSVHVTPELYEQARQENSLRRQYAWTALARQNHVDYTLRRFRIDYLAMIRQRLEPSEAGESERCFEKSAC
ncbi:MAG: sulfotransferase [Candidatus Electrothrix sp. ATG1]|nr:sulfotransferase [Candidatus Electrothrix sp. ATG1]